MKKTLCEWTSLLWTQSHSQRIQKLYSQALTWQSGEKAKQAWLGGESGAKEAFSALWDSKDFESWASEQLLGPNGNGRDQSSQNLWRPTKSWLTQALDQVDRVSATLHQLNGHHLYPGHPEYPVRLYRLEVPPLFLSRLGPVLPNDSLAISVIGSREAAPKAKEWMIQELGPLVREGAWLVSGGAQGIDQMAHQICLEQGRPTLVLLPSGLGQIYPRDLYHWRQRVVESGGSFLSEYAPDEPMRTHHFRQRNRMIAALGAFLLVVQAKVRSGSYMTAQLALLGGFEIGVVPGFPLEGSWSGNLELLFSGAHLIRDKKDLRILLARTSSQIVETHDKENYI